MNSFTKMFLRNNWKVESLDTNSFCAENGVFCVFFSVYQNGGEIASAVSYLMEDKKSIIDAWKTYNKDSRFPTPIGTFVYSDWVNHQRFFHMGGVCNHDHTCWEVESWVKRLAE